jgi:hypothetical protein
MTKPDLGRVGRLAEAVRAEARNVTNDMRLSAGGDAYEYRGSTSAVDALIEALIELEDFQNGWITVPD